jgi:hypothetical protein
MAACDLSGRYNADHGTPAAALNQSNVRQDFNAVPSYSFGSSCSEGRDDILAKLPLVLLLVFPIESKWGRLSGMQP